MIILLKVAIFLLNIVYFFIKLFPATNKIVMISRQDNGTTVDFELLKKEFEKRGKYKIVILAKKLNPGIFNKIGYIFHMIRQMYEISTSKVVILDSYCIVVSVLKHKKDLKIIQMWHAMGSLKKFGLSSVNSTSALKKKMDVNKKKKLNEVMRMHKNYDYFFVSSESAKKYFAEAFGTSLEKGVVMPLPVVDLLTCDEYKKNIIRQIKNTYSVMNDKKNILYVPTFREEENEEKIRDLIESIDYNKYNLIIKLHPLTKLKTFDERVIWDKKYKSRDMMIASDYVITDYSAIVYEAVILNKPIYFYIYDYEEYSKKRDFYIDFKKELPGKMSSNAKDIIKFINNNDYDLDRIKKFSSKYIDINNDTSCRRIADFVDDILNKD